MTEIIRAKTDRRDPVLSIIVPIYNVGPYLDRCLDSFLKADGIEETEMILVDDGSTDNSGSIADLYAGQYDFISCFHKENGGLSDARNFGLEKSSGKYVFFCDSDDMVVPGALENLIKTLSQSDVEVILFDGLVIDENDSVIDSEYDVILNHSGLDGSKVTSGIETMVCEIQDHGRFAVTAWLRACRRDYLLDNGLLFEKGIIHEDELWTPQVMAGAVKVRYIQERLYCYRLRQNSIMRDSVKDQEKHAGALVYVMNSIYVYYSKNLKESRDKDLLLAHWADTYLWMILEYGIGKYECGKKIDRRAILTGSNGIRSRIKALILNLFGVRIYTRLLERKK